jgi:hypothetical protein
LTDKILKKIAYPNILINYMKILIVTIITLFILGFLFVRWANKPENVEAFRKQKQTEEIQRIDGEKRDAKMRKAQVLVNKNEEEEKSAARIVIDENFEKGRFEKLRFNYADISYFRFGKDAFTFSGMVTKGENAQDYFIVSEEDFSDFPAEMQVGIWGGDAFTGIFWDAKENGAKNPDEYQVAYASPDRLHMKAGGEEDDYVLGGVVASENNQLIRVERFSQSLKVSVNGKIYVNEKVKSGDRGKVGILTGHRGGVRIGVQSISIAIKSFKVWR